MLLSVSLKSKRVRDLAARLVDGVADLLDGRPRTRRRSVGMCLQRTVAKRLVSYAPLGRYPSGQRGQSVKLLRKLRWFESSPAHHSPFGPAPLSAGRAIRISRRDDLRRRRRYWGAMAAPLAGRRRVAAPSPSRRSCVTSRPARLRLPVRQELTRRRATSRSRMTGSIYDEDADSSTSARSLSPTQLRRLPATEELDGRLRRAPKPEPAAPQRARARRHPYGYRPGARARPRRARHVLAEAMRNLVVPVDELIDADAARCSTPRSSASTAAGSPARRQHRGPRVAQLIARVSTAIPTRHRRSSPSTRSSILDAETKEESTSSSSAAKLDCYERNK